LTADGVWLPVYFPVFYPGVPVAVGDTIEATVWGELADDGFNRNYRISGRLFRLDGQSRSFEYRSEHTHRRFRNDLFYQRLFDANGALARAGSAVASSQDLRAFLQQTLPDYMIPGAFVSLPALPLTSSGKVDRRALPAPTPLGGSRERRLTLPRTATEIALAEIWRKVLKLERLSTEDDFFEVGGHSLLASQIVARIRERFDVSLTLRRFFQYPSITKLAAAVDKESGTAPAMTERITPVARQHYRANRTVLQ